MTDIAAVCGLCVCAAVMCKITEKYSKEQAVLLVLAVCAAVFLSVADGIMPVLSKMEELTDRSGLDREYVSIIFKALGICWLTQFASDICRDCGENAIGSAAEVFGKIQLALLALPLLEDIVSVVTEML